MMVAGGLLVVLTLITGQAPILFAGLLAAIILPLLLGVLYSWRLARKG